MKVGLDLDGVVAKHPWGGFWVWLRKLKEKMLKKVGDKDYFYPASGVERWSWKVIDWSKKPAVRKKGLEEKEVEFYLVTSRFKFLGKLTLRWLELYGLKKVFKKIIINVDDLDPAKFKTKVVKKFELDIFVDDELEILRVLEKKTKAKLYWVVPEHRDKRENGNKEIVSKNSLKEFLECI
jgi:hypothetical protein